MHSYSKQLFPHPALRLVEMITRLLFIGDLHAGSKVGFLPKGYRDVETGARYNLGASQKLIWKQFKWIEKHCMEGCDELILVLMSDLVHGPDLDHPAQVITPDVKTQAEMVIHAFLPIANKATSIYAIDALSRYHVDAGRFADDFIASELGAFGRRAYVRHDIVVQDVHLRLKHHGPTLGYRPHTRGDSVRRFLRDSHTEALQEGEKTPDVFVFAHWHNYYREVVTVQGPGYSKDISAYYCPPMTFPDKRTQNVIQRLEWSDIGALAIDVEDGRISYHEWFKRFSLRKMIRH